MLFIKRKSRVPVGTRLSSSAAIESVPVLPALAPVGRAALLAAPVPDADAHEVAAAGVDPPFDLLTVGAVAHQDVAHLGVGNARPAAVLRGSAQVQERVVGVVAQPEHLPAADIVVVVPVTGERQGAADGHGKHGDCCDHQHECLPNHSRNSSIYGPTTGPVKDQTLARYHTYLLSQGACAQEKRPRI